MVEKLYVGRTTAGNSSDTACSDCNFTMIPCEHCEDTIRIFEVAPSDNNSLSSKITHNGQLSSDCCLFICLKRKALSGKTVHHDIVHICIRTRLLLNHKRQW